MNNTERLKRPKLTICKSEEFLTLLSGVGRGGAAIFPLLATKITDEFARQPNREAEPSPSSKAELTAGAGFRLARGLDSQQAGILP